MNNTEQQQTKVLKESKNRIRVDFERTSRWTRFRIKYLNSNYAVMLLYRMFRFLLLLGVAFVILFPFYSKIFGSFMDREDFVDVTVKLIPKHWTIDQYKYIITENGFFKAMGNTFILSLVCALLQTITCCIIAYGFAKFKFKFNKLLFMLVIFTMVVPHIVLRYAMISEFNYFKPLYLEAFWNGIKNIAGEGGFIAGFKSAKGFNLLNSYWPMAILSVTGLAYKNGLYIFMLRQFFKGVPDELEESAYIDGSGVFRTFVTIIIPLSVPMMLTVFIFAFSWQWTDNFYTNMFFNNAGPKLIPSIVRVPKSLSTDASFAGKKNYDSAIRNTCSLLIILPLIILYLFFQKSLVQGIERSGITG
ncbi:MAG: carbohydrate ABC transporter permease [Clostridia bacterium]|nr:carbohydrate ABC transporter permease [Clostridia bacterium]